jgi:hypothetical protein
VTIPENVDVILSMFLDDRRTSAKEMAEILAISRGYILNMRKLSAKRVPKCLNAVQRCGFTSHFGPISTGFCKILDRLVTTADTWIDLRYRDQITIQGMETNWFSASKEQGTQFVRLSVGVCCLGDRWNFACRLPGRVCTAKYNVALLDKLK